MGMLEFSYGTWGGGGGGGGGVRKGRKSPPPPSSPPCMNPCVYIIIIEQSVTCNNQGM